MISTLPSSICRFSAVSLAGALLWCVLVSGGWPQEPAAAPTARLIVLIETEPFHSFLGDLYGRSYYQTPEVECWLDGQKLYIGPVHKPGKITKIYDGPVESGEHLLRLRWQARLRIIEGYKWDRKDGQKLIVVPETGFQEERVVFPPGSTRILKAIVRRTATLKELRIELIIQDVTETARPIATGGHQNGGQ